tara:strand:+ start:505 stop:1200 length:696 start_codon:yes stop_codon:yes gene_type:complete
MIEMEYYGEDFLGVKPAWVQGLTPANYADYESVWQTIDFANFEDIFYDLIEQCNLGEIIFQEEKVSKYITNQLRRQGFYYENQPSPIRDREAYAEYSELRQQALQDIRNSTDYAKTWWDVLKPLTSSKLSSTQLVFTLSSHGGPDTADWTDCTLYEQTHVDDYREYPGSKLCEVKLHGYLLVDSASASLPYQTPVAYYIYDVELDEDAVLDVVENVYEPDWDSMPGGHDDY